ncbi:MAG: hypothetical protein HY261_03205 [Chloroflexi bacterium]|nr:hypothetical protein [Chloroflexota bacterium]
MEPIARVAGGVAHDINNLLTPITGYGELLLEGLDEQSEERGDIQTMLKAANELAALARLLQVIAGRQLAPAKAVDLSEIAAGITRPATPGIRVELALAPNLWPVAADASQMSHVLLALEANARDAMPDGGTLYIETANLRLTSRKAHRLGLRPGDFVVLTVRDTGTGIAPRVRRNLFQPYFTTKARGTGKGLGLAFVRGVVQQAGGAIEVASRRGAGSTFRIYLPRLRERSPNGTAGTAVTGGTAQPR